MVPLVSYRKYDQVCCSKDQKYLKETTRAIKKAKESNNVLADKDLSHIVWWQEVCVLSYSTQLLERLQL